MIVKHVVTDAPRPSDATRTTAPKSSPAAPKASNAERALVVPSGAPASFAGLAATLPGQVGLAVAPLGAGHITTLGALQAGHAWSTMKVPVLVTLLKDYAQGGRQLSTEEQSEASLALEQSDNAAAEALFSQLEQLHGGLVGASLAVQQTLRSAGDHVTVINTAPNDQGFTTWGQSIWSTSGEVEFYRALAHGCVLGSADTAYVLSLMRNVIASQRWGAGSAGYPGGLDVAFKAGWGPETGGTGAYLVRQTAIVSSGSRGAVISMIALPSDGTFSEGVSMITSVAKWARAELDATAPRPSAGCD